MLKNKKCETCELEHNGDYGSGRFCSNKCARSFSTKYKRAEINEKVKNTLLLKNYVLKEQREEQRIKKRLSYIRETEATTLFDLSKRTIVKILKRLKLSCSNCNWYVEDVACDVHHIIPVKKGGSNEHTNLCYLCPNCHRLVHSNKIDSDILISLHDYIGDEWKKYYFIKNNKLVNEL